MFLIWNIERNMWWKPNKRGYTENIDEAGHYTKSQMIEIVSTANIVKIEELPISLNIWKEINSYKECDNYERFKMMYKLTHGIDITIGFWYCEESPIKFCFYDHNNDPLHDICLACDEPEERK